jgi:hypothetical protein
MALVTLRIYPDFLTFCGPLTAFTLPESTISAARKLVAMMSMKHRVQDK